MLIRCYDDFFSDMANKNPPYFRTSTGFYSGCQKNVPLFERFFLQPLIPPFRISKRIFEKRYKPSNHPYSLKRGLWIVSISRLITHDL